MKSNRWTAKEIKALREELQLTQADFGKRLGVSGNYIWMLEAGKKKPSETLRLLFACVERDKLSYEDQGN
jgi:DNA-binding transcriptional regulator YiaG